MGRARVGIGGRSGGRLRGTAPGGAPARVEVVAQLSQLAGNRAVSQMFAQRWSEAPPIKDRRPIDQLAKNASVTPVDRCRAYATIADTQKVGIDPAKVHVSAYSEPGLNLASFPQDKETGATTKWIDVSNRSSGGAPPEKVKGIAIVVNSNSNRFEDEDYMVAAIRHEMVHVRLFELTLKHRTAWQQAKSGLSFSQYAEKHVRGVDQALVKDRYFGGQMDETIAYLEGFLTAYDYSAVAPPQAGDRAWIAHLKGFTKKYQTAWLNDKPLPKSLKGISEQNIAIRLSATAVVKESEKRVKDYCKAAGAKRCANLAAWVQHLSRISDPEVHRAALKMIYKAATGKALSTPAATTAPGSKR